MTKNTKNRKKASASKKLIPAIGMLTVSAMMLSTATYAWFTMSREVEVNNIRMTATVPEDIQISLGHLVDFTTAGDGDALVANASTFTGLAGNQGILKAASNENGATADNGQVMAPYNKNDAVSALDWASSADISEYYRLGKIIPASSTTGWDIYFTPDAAGVGKTLKAGAKYYQAAAGLTAQRESTAGRTATQEDPDGSLKTTLHAINNVTEASDEWNLDATHLGTYKTATEWNNTKDDGYYVDIPIWFRSSAQSELTLAVDAYVTTTQAKDEDDLYLAARAVILYNDTAEGDSSTNKGGYASDPVNTEQKSGTTKPLRIRQDNYQGESIVNYMYSTVSTGDAVASVANNAATYGNVTEYAGDQFLKVAGTTENGYGPMTKAIVRVWLEGEDPNCWNSNAGQDFAISLKFTKDALSATAEPKTYPESKINHENADDMYGAADNANSLKAGARVWVKSTTKPSGAAAALTDELQFEYNGDKWSLVTDGSFHKYEGFTYSFGSNNNIQTSDDIAKELKTLVTNLNAVNTNSDKTSTTLVVTATAVQG